MTYCLGIKTRRGLVLASDSRSNAGLDQVSVCRKMHVLERPGERAFVLATSGSVSLSQSVMTMLREEFAAGRGLAEADSLYAAARCVGEQVRRVADADRAALERDHIPFNVHLLLAGQIRGGDHDLYLIYPQGNPLRATRDCPYLQLGEAKYGRPILERGIRFDETTLEEAAKYALLSLDSTMRSNMTVGPPVDLVIYGADELKVRWHCRFHEADPQWRTIHTLWDQALRQAVQSLPEIRFADAEDRPA
jgi:putative proteasome-type protease